MYDPVPLHELERFVVLGRQTDLRSVHSQRCNHRTHTDSGVHTPIGLAAQTCAALRHAAFVSAARSPHTTPTPARHHHYGINTVALFRAYCCDPHFLLEHLGHRAGLSSLVRECETQLLVFFRPAMCRACHQKASDTREDLGIETKHASSRTMRGCRTAWHSAFRGNAGIPPRRYSPQTLASTGPAFH
jgi:hypothetical protein